MLLAKTAVSARLRTVTFIRDGLVDNQRISHVVGRVLATAAADAATVRT